MLANTDQIGLFGCYSMLCPGSTDLLKFELSEVQSDLYFSFLRSAELRNGKKFDTFSFVDAPHQITVDWARFFQCTLPPIDSAASSSCGVGSSLYQWWMSRVWAYRLCSARLIHADEGDARFSARVRLMTLSCWCLCVLLGGILAKLNEEGSL